MNFGTNFTHDLGRSRYKKCKKLHISYHFHRQHPPEPTRTQPTKKTRAVPVPFPGFPDVVEERRGGLFAATTLGTAPWGVTGLDDYLIATPGSSRYTPPKFNMVHLNINPWKEEIPNLETIIFRFHVKLWGGSYFSVNFGTNFTHNFGRSRYEPLGGSSQLLSTSG